MNAPSAKLREAFESLGYRHVQTIISSGNVIFDTDESNAALLEKHIEGKLHEILGLATTALIRSASQISELIATHPFGSLKHSRSSYLTVSFLRHAPLTPVQTDTIILGYDHANQALYAVNDATHMQIPKFMTQLEKTFGKEITTRTWNTALRVFQKMA